MESWRAPVGKNASSAATCLIFMRITCQFSAYHVPAFLVDRYRPLDVRGSEFLSSWSSMKPTGALASLFVSNGFSYPMFCDLKDVTESEATI